MAAPARRAMLIMMRPLFALLLLALSAGGCTSVQLNREALRSERRAELLAERGDGAGAARERDRALRLRLEAKTHAGRNDWLNR